MNRKIFKSKWWILCAIFFLSLVLFGMYEKENKMHEMPKGLVEFDVLAPLPVCSTWKENMPATRDKEAFDIYISARKLFRSKIEYQFTKKELEMVLDRVNVAAKKGDWGAKALLAKFYREGLGPFESNRVLDKYPEESVKISKAAMEVGQPWGYYDLGVAYEHGYGGVPFDLKIAWAYYLKAAKLGSPDAQMALSQAYMKAGRREEARAMQEYAYRQGHGPAAYELALAKDIEGKAAEALNLYHTGVKFGCEQCASTLNLVFLMHKYADEILKPLGFSVDAERAHRYELIEATLKINPDLRFSRLDEALPLPPKALPEWHGIEDAMTPEPEGPPTY